MIRRPPRSTLFPYTALSRSAERAEPLRVPRLREDQVEAAVLYFTREPTDARPQHGFDHARERVEHAQQDDDLPIVPVSQARGVPEEHREREQRRDDPEDRAEQARREAGAVLQLFGAADAPASRANAEFHPTSAPYFRNP